MLKRKGSPPRENFRLLVQSLSREHRMLVVLRDELYEQSWAEMRDDLQARLEGKAYVFKLASRIQDDLERIETLEKLERNYRVDLGDYIKLGLNN